MSPYLVIAFLVGYFLVLWTISWFTSRGADNAGFFLGNRQSPWYVVAFGMIGASLSGITFISVPGWVAQSQWSYMQMVFGYFPGYLVIAFVLMPLYYRLKLTSIYTYLDTRFGSRSYQSGAWLFLVSRLIGSSFRLYIVAIVIQLAVFEPLGWNLPFVVPVIVTVVLIWLYTYRGGIKTIIWTDTMQTFFMLLAVVLTIWAISNQMHWSIGEMIHKVKDSDYSKVFFFHDYKSPHFFWKEFISGMFITIVMTGLDQDMMQKNLSCRSIGDAKKNMITFSVVLIAVNVLFLCLGSLLYLYANAHPGIAIPKEGDYLYPTLAVGGYLGGAVALLFILGLVASAYSSADSALTALTTSFSLDILRIDRKSDKDAERMRRRVHVGMSGAMVMVIVLFRLVNDKSVISQLFTVAGYTYGPLLGLYSYGLLTKKPINDKWVPYICIISPVICFIFKTYSADIFPGYKVGYELLLLNGLLTYFGLWISRNFRKPGLEV